MGITQSLPIVSVILSVANGSRNVSGKVPARDPSYRQDDTNAVILVLLGQLY